jgi:hypothetical protein
MAIGQFRQCNALKITRIFGFAHRSDASADHPADRACAVSFSSW